MRNRRRCRLRELSSSSVSAKPAIDGERRLELVRDVGDEVPAYGLEPAQLGEIVNDQYGAPGGQRAGIDEKRAAVHLELAILDRLALEDGIHNLPGRLHPEELAQVGERIGRRRSRGVCGPQDSR